MNFKKRSSKRYPSLQLILQFKNCNMQSFDRGGGLLSKLQDRFVTIQ